MNSFLCNLMENNRANTSLYFPFACNAISTAKGLSFHLKCLNSTMYFVEATIHFHCAWTFYDHKGLYDFLYYTPWEGGVAAIFVF